MTHDTLTRANDLLAGIEAIDLMMEYVGDMGKYKNFCLVAEGHPHRVYPTEEASRNILTAEIDRLTNEKKKLLEELEAL